MKDNFGRPGALATQKLPVGEIKAPIPGRDRRLVTDINKATWNNLIHGGCQTRGVFHNNVFPPSAHVTYQNHDMRGLPVNKTLRGQVRYQTLPGPQ